mgnify:CR=1 FL=1
MKQDDVREQIADIILHNLNTALLSDGSFDKKVIIPIMGLFSSHSTSLLQKMEKKKKGFDDISKANKEMGEYGIGRIDGYNKCLSDCIAMIKKEYEK